MSNRVYIVHCIDTEGPLCESIEATFERLKETFDLEFEPRRETLVRLQNGAIDLGGREQAVQAMVASQILQYNETWDAVDEMLRDAMGPAFRNKLSDAEGKGWIYNWFCVDHVDYNVNPRRRDIGFHNIYDHYLAMMEETDSSQDRIHFHYHPHTFQNHAHRSGTHWWAFSDSLAQVISRRVIDRLWFPTVNRPGFHVNRPDSHWFMEQYIPFDYANQAMEVTEADSRQRFITDGRFGDWRRAPQSWTPYRPSHDDYQRPGNCRRWIARCLNVGTRHRLLNEEEVRRAFQQAREGQPAILAFTNHDFRDIRPDVDQVRSLLRTVAPAYPDVEFVYAEAAHAMREALSLPAQPPCDLDLAWVHKSDTAYTLEVTSSTPSFGPQPWLAVKTTSGTYLNDNFDIQEPFHKWTYTFDLNTIPYRAVEKIGVAVNNAYGIASVVVFDTEADSETRRTLNASPVLLQNA